MASTGESTTWQMRMDSVPPWTPTSRAPHLVLAPTLSSTLHQSFHRFPQELYWEVHLQPMRLGLRHLTTLGAYSGYGKYGYNPYSGAAGAYGYAPYARIGYAPGGPTLGVQAYGGSAREAYGASGFGGTYVPGAYGNPAGYGHLPSAHHGYRRR
ncbi:hypothetical protein MTO96_034720 [Rhipicephalus appendiculatus]